MEYSILLSDLRIYLTNLPDTLLLPPIPSNYNFGAFAVRPEDVNDMGLEGAVNRQLEVKFGTRSNGLITFTERGPDLVAVVDVLEKYLVECPEPIILEKWLEDLMAAAKATYLTANIPFPDISTYTTGGPPATKAPAPKPQGAAKIVTPTGSSAIKKPKVIPDTKILDDFDDQLWEDVEEAREPTRPNGAHTLSLLFEAAKVTLATVEYLKTCRNLTLSFDGGKTRRRQAFYSIHVTTPQRRSFLIDLDDASYVRHTGNYIKERVDETMMTIGPFNFSLVVADNTGNTKKARRDVEKSHEQVMNMQDSCHELSLTHKDISKLDEFKRDAANTNILTCKFQMISLMRKLLKFMSQSSLAAEPFERARKAHGITRGLETIGKTRFATLTWAAESVKRCLPAFRQVFRDYGTPFAKAIKCLESSLSTAADVYLFWLAAIAQLAQLFKENRIGLQTSTMGSIRAAVNNRFNGMINNAPNDVYIMAFFLDPREQNSSILLHMLKAGAGNRDVPVWKNALVELLKREYGNASSEAAMQIRNPQLAHLAPKDAASALKTEFSLYVSGADPFNRKMRTGDTILHWWEQVKRDELCTVLGVLAEKIFSVVPNSMADERTASEITLLNQARRSRQKLATIADMIRIRQYHRNSPEKPVEKKAPTVKWRDMSDLLKNSNELMQLPTAANPKDAPPVEVIDIDSSDSSDDDLDDDLDEEDGDEERGRVATTAVSFDIEAEVDVLSSVLQELLIDGPPTAARASRPAVSTQPAASSSAWTDADSYTWDTTF
ncbi:hypothetical protein BV25DRAFT_1806052 [Artomyces pyxidatus]|uniref:Uncharacterized protein n=2 Tax=Artomyces pyxidatus TaxID=48021 RepID=A0ACB8SEL4_9AGAM|nr:hypothetical protein BV25DRAFT_1817144 [Artomyces pyxidatus]KAI0061072.1 hypothetical protein BV25DRAFT_1806052 [Artomyces pyxidatus]